MRYYDTAFFCDGGKGPIAHVEYSKSESLWPITLVINPCELSHEKPAVRFYINSEEDLLKFRNSVMYAVDAAILNFEEHSNG